MEKSYRKKANWPINVAVLCDVVLHQVLYTIDLVGRRVFVSEDAPPSEEAERIAEAAVAAAQSTSEEIPQACQS